MSKSRRTKAELLTSKIEERVEPPNRYWFKFISPRFQSYLVRAYMGQENYYNLKSDSTRLILLKASLKEFEKDMVKKHGSMNEYKLSCCNRASYSTRWSREWERLKERGFNRPTDMLNYYAQKAGFKDVYERKRFNRHKKKGCVCGFCNEVYLRRIQSIGDKKEREKIINERLAFLEKNTHIFKKEIRKIKDFESFKGDLKEGVVGG